MAWLRQPLAWQAACSALKSVAYAAVLSPAVQPNAGEYLCWIGNSKCIGACSGRFARSDSPCIPDKFVQIAMHTTCTSCYHHHDLSRLAIVRCEIPLQSAWLRVPEFCSRESAVPPESRCVNRTSSCKRSARRTAAPAIMCGTPAEYVYHFDSNLHAADGL